VHFQNNTKSHLFFLKKTPSNVPGTDEFVAVDTEKQQRHERQGHDVKHCEHEGDGKHRCVKSLETRLREIRGKLELAADLDAQQRARDPIRDVCVHQERQEHKYPDEPVAVKLALAIVVVVRDCSKLTRVSG
jgi:hypothetical protein